MKRFNRVMAGRGSEYAQQCVDGGFIGIDYGINMDLSNRLPDRWQDFNAEFRPVFLQSHPGKTQVAAGLACGMIWTLSKGLEEGDVVVTPDGKGRYYAGEIAGPYSHVPDEPLQHRRPVEWFPRQFDRSEMSDALRRTSGSAGTCCDISAYADELERLIGAAPDLISRDPTVEDPTVFALEKHLEDFLITNWMSTDLGKQYDIFEEDGELVGQQYQTDTGPIDILAISKDKKRLLVVELKRGRANDVVVGQIHRYMGYVQGELIEPGQSVQGVIIALEDDLGLRRALAVARNIDFYRYKVHFELEKA